MRTTHFRYDYRMFCIKYARLISRIFKHCEFRTGDLWNPGTCSCNVCATLDVYDEYVYKQAHWHPESTFVVVDESVCYFNEGDEEVAWVPTILDVQRAIYMYNMKLNREERWAGSDEKALLVFLKKLKELGVKFANMSDNVLDDAIEELSAICDKNEKELKEKMSKKQFKLGR